MKTAIRSSYRHRGRGRAAWLILAVVCLLAALLPAQPTTQPSTAPAASAPAATMPAASAPAEADEAGSDRALPPRPDLATDINSLSRYRGPEMARLIEHLAGRGLYRAITRPSEDRRLSLVRPGQIAVVEVEEGDRVGEGDVLIRLDTSAEQVELARLEALAEDTVNIEAAEARLAKSRVDYQRTLDAFERGGATQAERDAAELDVLIAELSLRYTRSEHQQEVFRYEFELAQIERTVMHSPIDGVVETILKREGESIEAHEEIVRIISVDPLHIDVPVPEFQAQAIEIDDVAWVWLPGAAQPGRATVTYKAAEADAASNTQIVRIALDNPDVRSAGQHVYVNFGPEPIRPVLPERMTSVLP